MHDQKATGIGDVSLVGAAWLFAPRTHAGGDIALGVGVKAPTGSTALTGSVWST